MRKSRYTDEQMVKIMREADRSAVADVATKHGVSEQTIYVWRGRLKKLVAERDLEIEVMKSIRGIS